MRGFTRLVLLCLAVFNARATVIVAVRTPADVSIAADSMGTFADGPRTVCKIYRIGDVFLGVAGIAVDPVTKFNVADIVSGAIRNEQDITDQLASSASAVNSIFRSELRDLGVTRPREFEWAIKDGVMIVLIAFQNGTPSLAGQELTASLDSKGNVQVVPSSPKRCPGADCPNGVYVLNLGGDQAIEARYTASHRQVSDSADFARALVQLQIDAHAPGIGGPIDYLRLSAKGPEWIKRKAQCPEVWTTSITHNR
jgi:hypothetical protein